MKILLATDGSKYSNGALEEVSKKVFLPNSEVRIISVYRESTQILEMDPMGTLRQYYAEMEQNASKIAKSIAEDAVKTLHYKNPQLAVSIIVIGGSAKDLILEEANLFGADLIVVGSHGYGPIKSFLLGSVSHAIALHAKCSVEIVRIDKLNNPK